MSKFDFIAVCTTLNNSTALSDHIHEKSAGVSNNYVNFEVNFCIFIKYRVEAASTPDLVTLPITSQELDRGLSCPLSTKIDVRTIRLSNTYLCVQQL